MHGATDVAVDHVRLLCRRRLRAAEGLLPRRGLLAALLGRRGLLRARLLPGAHLALLRDALLLAGYHGCCSSPP